MCLILLAWRARADYPLVLAANRDEFYLRPSAPAQFWKDRPDILGGRDLEKGGTWLAVSRAGRLAAVTNYRDGRGRRAARRSRGELVAGFVAGTDEPDRYVAGLAATAADYDGFNLVVGSLWGGIAYYSNRGGAPHRLQPGVHGLSNHLLNSPWPKVERGKAGLLDLLAAPVDDLVPALFALLEDQTPPPDHLLPDTGVGHAWERVLSTAFVRTPDYGTRCTTVILADAAGQVRFIEHTHAVGTSPAERRAYAFQASPAIAGATP
jgi:uncharacterized protein with NRDE domain